MVCVEFQRELTRELAREISIAEPPTRGAYAWDFVAQGAAVSGLSFSRASAATYYGTSGALLTAAADEARIDYDPVSLQPRGLLIEEGRTNYLRNSMVPATQSISLSAGSYIFWVVGSGSCAVSAGTAAGSGFGTATAGNPVIFSISVAGSVTFTVVGSLSHFQVENGTVASSLIVTGGSAVSRSSDQCTLSLAGVLNPNEGAFVVEYVVAANSLNIIGFDNGSGGTTQRGHVMATPNSRQFNISFNGSVVSTPVTSGALTLGSIAKAAFGYSVKTGTLGLAVNGAAAVSATVVTEPFTPAVARVGCRFLPAARDFYNGHIRKITYYPRDVSLTELSVLSA